MRSANRIRRGGAEIAETPNTRVLKYVLRSKALIYLTIKKTASLRGAGQKRACEVGARRQRRPAASARYRQRHRRTSQAL